MVTAVFVQEGDQIDYTPTADVAAGEIVVRGDLVGIARTPIAANTPGSLAVVGVFDAPKAVDAGVQFAAGALAWWDAGHERAVTGSGGGVHKLLGKVVQAAADGDATVRVRLCPCAAAAGDAEGSSSSALAGSSSGSASSDSSGSE